jgi:hypothetical protein
MVRTFKVEFMASRQASNTITQRHICQESRQIEETDEGIEVDHVNPVWSSEITYIFLQR